MARVEWALLCDLAYFDTYRNLCVIGAPTRSPVPALAVGTHRVTIVARVVGLRRRPDVAVSVSTPDGPRIATTFCERLEIEAVDDYLLVRLGGVPLAREGIYRFEVSVNFRLFVDLNARFRGLDRRVSGRAAWPGARYASRRRAARGPRGLPS
jgi:hypothetical protein